MTDKDGQRESTTRHDRVRDAVELGAEIVGGAAGSTLGFLLAGPAGAAVSGAAGALITRSLIVAGEEVCDRILSPREKARVGATLAIAADRIQERIDSGDRVREDGFVDGVDGRAPIEEVTEGLLLAAQRAYDEKKVPYIGRLSANLNFRPDLNVQAASLLVRVADQLSYQQLCLLRLCHDNVTGRPLTGGKAGGRVKSPAHAALLSDLLELERSGFINMNGSAVLGLTDIDPPSARLQLFGVHLFDLMELGRIPDDDLDPIRQTLEAPEITFIGVRIEPQTTDGAPLVASQWATGASGTLSSGAESWANGPGSSASRVKGVSVRANPAVGAPDTTDMRGE